MEINMWLTALSGAKLEKKPLFELILCNIKIKLKSICDLQLPGELN